MEASDKPCPWHATIVGDRGRLVTNYCEVGPEGHEGAHIGERNREEYLRRLRIYLSTKNRFGGQKN